MSANAGLNREETERSFRINNELHELLPAAIATPELTLSLRTVMGVANADDRFHLQNGHQEFWYKSRTNKSLPV